MSKKRVLFIGDMHCGHRAGLTPPEHHGLITDPNILHNQRTIWEFFQNDIINKYKPFDICIHNGDTIDGKGEKSGGTELIQADRMDQCKIAQRCLERVDAKKYYFTYGTPYHTGKDEDFEGLIAEYFDTTIGGHEWFDVNGLIFDVKHKIGSSQIPHGRFTAIAKEKVWNLFWNEIDGAPKSNIFIRSHVHYFAYSGNRTFLGVVLPALQTFGSKYGVRQCSGIVDIGAVIFDVYDDGTYDMIPVLFENIKSIVSEPIKC